QELDELERAALVLGELADRQVVPAQGGLAGAGEPGNRGHAELAGDLAGSVRRAGLRVHVRPVAVEEELAVLERAAALLLLVGDRVLREQARLQPVDEEVETGLGGGAVHHRLALVVDDLSTGGVDGLAEVSGGALVL